MSEKSKECDPEVRAEKAKKLAVAGTAAGVLLIIFLVIVLIIQFVQIGVRNSEKARLEQEIENYETLISQEEKDLEYYQSEAYLQSLVMQAGYHKP